MTTGVVMKDLELENSLKKMKANQEHTDDKTHMPVDLERDIEALAEELANEEVQKKPPGNELMSLQAYKSKLKEEIKETLQMREVGESLSMGIFMIMQQGKNYLDLAAFTQVIDEFESAFDHLMKMDSTAGIDKTFKELAAISDDTVGYIEKMAIQKHKEKDFISSMRLFVLLTVLIPNNFMYWIRLGINHQEVRNFNDALKAYSRAFHLNAINIPNHVFMAECYLEMGDKINALQECELLKVLIETQEVESRWKEHFSVLNRIVNEMK